MIRAAWDEQKDIRDVMVFLQGNGVSPTYAMKIYRQYGKDSVRIVSENPYRLAMDIFGIGFITADRIAANLGIPKESRIRAEAGILHVLHELSDEGHVYYPSTLSSRSVARSSKSGEENIPPALEGVAAQEKGDHRRRWKVGRGTWDERKSSLFDEVLRFRGRHRRSAENPGHLSQAVEAHQY